MKITILLLSLVTIMMVRAENFKKVFAAVQNVEEFYYSYLPYISQCTYNETKIFPGNATLQLMDDNTIFEHFVYQNMLVFWAPVMNGYSLMIALDQQITSNTGYILYNSQLSSYSRAIILYNVSNQGLQFTYVNPSINISTMTVQYQILSQVNIDLTVQSYEVLINCPNITNLNFAYLGNETFLFVCGWDAQGFTFIAQSQYNTVNMQNFYLFLEPGLFQIAPRSQILTDPFKTPKANWNCLLFVQTNSSCQLYFVQFIENFTNFTIYSLPQMQTEISLLINRIWSYQMKFQVNRWMDVLNSLKITSQNINQYFPGQIASVFVSNRENIFVEWTVNGTNYLCVFDGNGQLFWNVSYNGSIFYYGGRATFIYNADNEIFQLQISRPIYILSHQDYLQNETTQGSTSKKNVTFECTQNQNYTVQYEIYWTTKDYPSGYIKYVNSTPMYSTDVIYAFNLDEKFKIVGPDFHTLVTPPQNIKTIVINSNSFVINQQTIGIINVQTYNGGTISAVIITNNTIYQINNQYQLKVITVYPCGFTSIVSAQRSTFNTYIITNNLNQKCSCNLDFSQCGVITNSDAYASIDLDSSPFSKNSLLYGYIQQNQNNLVGMQPFLIKKNLYGLISQGLYISILQNNSVILVEVRSAKILSTVHMSCSKQNITDGDTYLNEFYDPILLLFCQQDTQLTQYIVRNNKFIFQRKIPLYNYKTRIDTKTFFPASVHVFISVDPLYEIQPPQTDCCVLRIDPTQYTVSAIVEIINANSILGVYNVRNIDVALLKGTSSAHTQYIIQSYYPRTWVTLNQSDSSLIDTPYQQFPISFQSPKYNFNVYYNISISFNLTAININFTQEKKNNKLFSKDNFLTYSKTTNTFIGTISYNFTRFACGPIFSTLFFRSDAANTNLQIEDHMILKSAKQIGKAGTSFIQIIDPFKWNVQNCTLNALMLFVQKNKMQIFAKLFNGIQMYYIQTISLNETNCKYYLNQIINTTAASLLSNCEGINYNYNSTIMVINFDPDLGNNSFTYNFSSVFFPITLREVFTIVRTGYPTLIAGIQEGPLSSQTGRLIICNNVSCSPLNVSTSLVFLINYGAYSSSIMYIIMSIDMEHISVFINPEVMGPQQKINPQYVFNYTNFIEDQYCSVIRILNATMSQAYITLSCKNYYYFMIMNFTTLQMPILSQFARYSQCDSYDQFRPATIFINNTIQMLYAQCRQNQYMLKLQEYETINSSNPVIYTGYMQVFSIKGPMGPNCQSNILSPQKIIPLSSSMDFQLFIEYEIYWSQQIIFKFIYSLLNGILIDNIANFNPQLTIKFQRQYQMYNDPKFQILVFNQYHQLSHQITINQILLNQNYFTALHIFTFAIFVLLNLITIVFFICFKKYERDRQLLQSLNREQFEQNVDQEFEGSDTRKLSVFSSMKPNPTEIEQSKTSKKRKQINQFKKNLRPSQIEMFFVKKK